VTRAPTGRVHFGGRRDSGMVLFISLVFLLMLTIVGVSGVQTSSLETRMARNEHDLLLAFQAAELALGDAERFVQSVTSTVPFNANGANGLWDFPELGEPNRWEDPELDIWRAAGQGSVVAETDVGNLVAAPPRYFIERLAAVARESPAYQIDDPYAPTAAKRIEIFRITALGTGGTANARVILQTTYGRVLD